MERRLAAILAADVVGYSRLMGHDEAGTLQALKALRAEVIDPKITKHKGRVFKETGDGVLVEFPSVVNAVACAVDVKRDMAGRDTDRPEDRAVQLRIGVNLGDVVVEGEDLFGDGVNVAARLEGIAPPGGIAVSAVVRDQIGNRLDLQFENMGELALKNIERPVRAYRLYLDGSAEASTPIRPVLTLPDKPSIAVLPFQNMSGDPEQDYFADGIVEEIIIALSRMKWLFVIARNSSFTYKGRPVDVKKVGRELGVRYVLEGSVRKVAHKIRITGQLIDVSTGAHLWAERFDSGLEDIFDLQDQVTTNVVGAIAPKLEQAEIERVKRKPTESLDAYDHYLRGMAATHQWTRDATDAAQAHIEQAFRLDPDFAAAYGMAARCYSMRKASGWVGDPVAEGAEAKRLALRAAELGQDDAVALSAAGLVLDHVTGDHDHGMELLKQALDIDPNYAWAWHFIAWAQALAGQSDAAIDSASRAIRLNPQEAQMSMINSALACAHYVAGRYAEALDWARKATRVKPDASLNILVLAAALAMSGDIARAQEAAIDLRRHEPRLRLSNLNNLLVASNPDVLSSFIEGMRKAGLPE